MVGAQPIQGYNQSVGIGYIALPSDIPRAEYISLCYKNSSVCIKCEDGSFYNRVPIDSVILNFIEFPFEVKDLGSPIVFINEPLKNQLIVIGVLNKVEDMQDNIEGQFKFKKKFGNSYVEIVGSAKGEYIGLTVDGQDKGEVYINVSNDTSTAKLNVEVLGDIFLKVSNNINLISHDKITLETLSNSDKDKEDSRAAFEQTKDENHFEAEKFTINSGEEAMLRGDRVKQFLDDFIDEVSKIKVATSIGLQPIVNKAQILAFKQKTKDLLSEVAFLE